MKKDNFSAYPQERKKKRYKAKYRRHGSKRTHKIKLK